MNVSKFAADNHLGLELWTHRDNRHYTLSVENSEDVIRYARPLNS